ncbi:MAG TPA: hypothetical protein VHZ55_13840, partial [Bryobacteraceae bacterium]|nr:hypothetical protein [Bryobacteraceae bacterium]
MKPREAWTTVVPIAALGFVNYLLLKLYSSRGLYYSELLGRHGKQHGHHSGAYGRRVAERYRYSYILERRVLQVIPAVIDEETTGHVPAAMLEELTNCMQQRRIGEG